jgi:hypothetical protein
MGFSPTFASWFVALRFADVEQPPYRTLHVTPRHPARRWNSLM